MTKTPTTTTKTSIITLIIASTALGFGLGVMAIGARCTPPAPEISRLNSPDTGYVNAEEGLSLVAYGEVLYSVTTIGDHGYPICKNGLLEIGVPWPLKERRGQTFVFDCSGDTADHGP